MATTNTANRALDRFVQKQVAACRAAAKEIASILEEYAKSHHPWQRDTGETDDTTKGEVKEAEAIIWIILSSDSPHSKYLELARNGRWAWLRPAVDANIDRIETILRKHLQGTVRSVVFESSAEFSR